MSHDFNAIIASGDGKKSYFQEGISYFLPSLGTVLQQVFVFPLQTIERGLLHEMI